MVHLLDQTDRGRWLDWLASSGTVHQHVGWHPVAYWLGRPASLSLSKSDGSIAASLLVSPDENGVAWIHLFAADSPPGEQAAWNALWPAALNILRALPVKGIWVMTTQSWLVALLRQSGFAGAGKVVALSLQPGKTWPAVEAGGRIEPMAEADLPFVEELDCAAFYPPWQMDLAALRVTIGRSDLATVFRTGGLITGYQMAVPTSQGIHLTRLAVDPRFQGKGIGRALVTHLLNHFHGKGVPWITVNTQSENQASLRLYSAFGFRRMHEVYPVFQYRIAARR
jgi:ribosomal protein S18 acetylase RimI-like enzyme